MTETPRLSFAELFRSYPATVCVVTTTTPDGRPSGSTCTAVMSLTDAPPSLLVSFMAASNTLADLTARGSFAVNVLGPGAEQAMRALASKNPDKFDRVPWHVPPGSVSQAPALAGDVFAYVDCSVQRLIDLDDHVLVVGAIHDIRRGDAEVPAVYADRVLGRHHTIPLVTQEAVTA